MLNYMIIFKKWFRTAQLIRFKVYSFMTPFPNSEVPGWGATICEGGRSIANINVDKEYNNR